jgi:hypothetical protein
MHRSLKCAPFLGNREHLFLGLDAVATPRTPGVTLATHERKISDQFRRLLRRSGLDRIKADHLLARIKVNHLLSCAQELLSDLVCAVAAMPQQRARLRELSCLGPAFHRRKAHPEERRHFTRCQKLIVCALHVGVPSHAGCGNPARRQDDCTALVALFPPWAASHQKWT